MKLGNQASCLWIQVHLWAQSVRDGIGSLVLGESARLPLEMVDEAHQIQARKACSSSFLPAGV